MVCLMETFYKTYGKLRVISLLVAFTVTCSAYVIDIEINEASREVFDRSCEDARGRDLMERNMRGDDNLSEREQREAVRYENDHRC